MNRKQRINRLFYIISLFTVIHYCGVFIQDSNAESRINMEILKKLTKRE